MVTAEQHQHQHQQPDCEHDSSENEFNDNINDENDESLEAARADVELLQAAYPDEIESITTDAEKDDVRFPLTVRLHFSKTTSCELQWREGYPDESTVEIVSWRIKDAREQPCLERALAALRSAARVGSNSDYAGVGMACCAAALEAWHGTHTADSSSASASTSVANLLAVSVSVSVSEGDLDVDDNNNNSIHCNTNSNHDNDNCCTWISGDPLVDRKSVFQAHLCRLENEANVAPALQQLLTSSSKMQRATHHMYAYRITEQHHQQQQQQQQQQQACRSYSASADKRSDPPGNNRRNKNTPADSAANEDAVVWVVKHDNSDDGEDGAGSRLAHLLQMRHDDNVLVVVSRWYGGIPLGPKRFAHISNVARTLLVQAQQQQQPQQQHSHNCRNSSTGTPKQKGNGKK